MVTNLGLLLHARGWASMWRTGSLVATAPVRDAFCVGPAEQLLGWLYVGTAGWSRRQPPPRPVADPVAHVLLMREDGRLAPVQPLAALAHG
jgi:hypothetical protein